jgi:aminopeptidase N
LLNLSRSHKPINFLVQYEPVTLKFGEAGDVIKANPGDYGYYRVQYDPAMSARLQREMPHLSAADGLNLLNDAWAMAEAGRSSTAEYFGLAISVRYETAYAVADQVISKLLWVDGLEQDQPGQISFRARARALLQPQLKRLGWEAKDAESPNDALLRSRVITALGRFEDPVVIAEAKSRFESFVKNAGSVKPDLRPAVLRTVGRFADRKTCDQLHELARKAAGVEERQLYLGAMTEALDPALARATLELSLTDELVPQEATALVGQVAGNGHAELAWEFARANIAKLLAKVDGFERNNYLPSIASAFSDAAQARELIEFVKKNVSEDAAMKAGEAAEQILFKSEFKQRELPVIDKWTSEPLPE